MLHFLQTLSKSAQTLPKSNGSHSYKSFTTGSFTTAFKTKVNPVLCWWAQMFVSLMFVADCQAQLSTFCDLCVYVCLQLSGCMFCKWRSNLDIDNSWITCVRPSTNKLKWKTTMEPYCRLQDSNHESSLMLVPKKISSNIGAFVDMVERQNGIQVVLHSWQ